MSTDYRVTGRSNSEVRELAEEFLRKCGADRRFPVNVLALLERDDIPTVSGPKKLVFTVVPDQELGENDAVTTFTAGLVMVTCRSSVRDRAVVGVGRDRMTLAHELGHAVMHEGPPMARGTGAVGSQSPTWIKPFESAEHQAKIFAPALLIREWAAGAMQSAEEVSTTFGVSLEAALIYFEELTRRRNHATSSARVEGMAAAFRQSVESRRSYLDATCPNCGKKTIRRTDSQRQCDTCRWNGTLQDGDPFDG